MLYLISKYCSKPPSAIVSTVWLKAGLFSPELNSHLLSADFSEGQPYPHRQRCSIDSR